MSWVEISDFEEIAEEVKFTSDSSKEDTEERTPPVQANFNKEIAELFDVPREQIPKTKSSRRVTTRSTSTRSTQPRSYSIKEL